jgi:septal ring factor EnvC (AmiA/AmiB activator)
MAQFGKALVLALAMVLGLWGCAQNNDPSASQAERLRQLENKVAKLEAECKSAMAARDKATKQVVALEEEAGQMRKTLAFQQNIIKERDALRLEIDARTVERDALQHRCEHFENGLQNLLKEYKAMGPAVAPPTTAASTAPSTNNS